MQAADQSSNSAQQEQDNLEALRLRITQLEKSLQQERATNNRLQHNGENPTVSDEPETEEVADPVVPSAVVNEATKGRPRFLRIRGAVFLLLIVISFQSPIQLVSGGLHRTTSHIATSSTTTWHIASSSPSTTDIEETSTSGSQGAAIENFCINDETVNSSNLWLIPIVMMLLVILNNDRLNIKLITLQAIGLIAVFGTVFSMAATCCYYKGFDGRQLDNSASILYSIVYSSLMLCSMIFICANESSKVFKTCSVLGFMCGILASVGSCAGTIAQVPFWTSLSAALNSFSALFGCLAVYCDWEAFEKALHLAKNNVEILYTVDMGFLIVM